MSEINLERFSRFSRSERIQHALLLVMVTLLALTGLPQKFSSMDWAPVMIRMLGGVEVARLIHRFCAFTLIAGMTYHVLYGLYRLVLKRARFEMLPRIRDFNDLKGNIAYFVGIKKERPRFERFNYIEKFEYWAVLWGMVVMTLTGLILWFPASAARILPGLAIPAAKAAHSGEAFLAITAVVIWHMYNAHMSPRVFPINKSIFNGKISRHELMSEHASEYERLTGEEVPGEVLAERPEVSWSMLLTSGLVGVLLVSMFTILLYWSITPPKPALLPPLHPPLERNSILVTETPYGADPTVFWAGLQAPPVADFSVAQEEVGEGGAAIQELRFHDQSTGQVTSWLWDFGDGETSMDQNPVHVYKGTCPAGDHCLVSLIACGPGGCNRLTRPTLIQPHR
jgi:formate dehydrogenase gamma subunit